MAFFTDKYRISSTDVQIECIYVFGHVNRGALGIHIGALRVQKVYAFSLHFSKSPINVLVV